MYTRFACFLLLCAFFAAPARAQNDAENRLYGRVTTTEGEVFEGLIRWDKNEVSWVDLLDGSKKILREERGDRRNRRSNRMRVFGIEFDWNDDGDAWRLSGLRLGHVRRLENVGRDRARLVLRSGQELELRGGSSDIGNDSRGIVIEDTRHGEVELKWRDLDYVDFMPAPRNVTSRYGTRLHGTLSTRDGQTFTGYVCWDVDEVLTDDTLDGDDARDRRRKIPFGEIERIARNNSRSARVVLRNGEEMILRGTNDVNDDNRDILVLDPQLGQVRVPWDEFDELLFTRPAFEIGYDDFHGGGPLRGTVYDRDGRAYKGLIRWDDDESLTWEMLNGKLDDIGFDIEFGFVAKIERLSAGSARVTLRDGRTFDLRGSNDITDDNDGLFIDDGNEVHVLDWPDFDRVVFDKP